MRYIKPDYFEEFNCIADKCPDTCCAGWQIMIDEDSLDRYEEEEGEFGNRLRRSIDWQEGSFLQHDGGRCAFLNAQNLCDIYANLGEEALCKTCKNYPRHIEEYDNLREISLSISCPVAAKLILGMKAKAMFVESEDDLEEELWEEFEDFDYLLFTQLEDAREVCFGIAQNREYLLEHRMQILMAMAGEMQECVDANEVVAIADVVEKYRKWTVAPSMIGNNSQDVSGQMKENEVSIDFDFTDWDYDEIRSLFATMYELERLRQDWTTVLESTYDTLYRKDEETYATIREDFEDYYLSDRANNEDWEIISEQILVLLLFTYLCGAVYDDWIVGKMKLAVDSVRFIRELLMARWVQKDEELTFEDYCEIAYRYAREIEHSDENLNALEEIVD